MNFDFGGCQADPDEPAVLVFSYEHLAIKSMYRYRACCLCASRQTSQANVRKDIGMSAKQSTLPQKLPAQHRAHFRKFGEDTRRVLQWAWAEVGAQK